MTVVSGTYADPSDPGIAAQGRIVFALVPAARDVAGVQRTPGPVVAELDETGSFTVDLVPDADLMVDGDVTYRVTEEVGALRRTWHLHLVDDTPVDLPSRYPGDLPGPVAVIPMPGPPGDEGPMGPPGEDGQQGPPGPGVPAGGGTGQVLAKTSGADYATGWADPASGGGGGGAPSGPAGGDLTGTYPNPGIADDSHAHTGATISNLDAADTATGTFAIGRIPTGTTASTVALGNAPGAAIAAHEAAADPHSQYATDADLAGKADAAHTHTHASTTGRDAADSHPQTAITGLTAALAGKEATGVAATLVAQHEAAADPHGQYQRESEKGQASGYAGLDTSARIPFAQTHISVGTSAPSSPATGDVWIDTT